MTAPAAKKWENAIHGCVDEASRTSVTGWVVGPEHRLPIQVGLFLDDLHVMTVWADEPSNANTISGARAFTVPIRGVWDYCQTSTRVSIRVDGMPLPWANKGIFKRPGSDGSSTLSDLRGLLAAGNVFNDQGVLQLSKKLDYPWQEAVIDLYQGVALVVDQCYGLDVFVMYGSLLGQVREEGFIGHDDDFDVAYVSTLTDGQSAAAELRDIAFSLIDAGFDVETKRSALHIHAKHDHSIRIDLFHLYFDNQGFLQLPFGRAGDSELKREDWQGTEAAQMGAHQVLRPKNPDRWVEHIYGPAWRTPKPGFHWSRARVAQAKAGLLPQDFREAGYWANFYAQNRYEKPSDFQQFIESYPDLPGVVLEIGCGDGRDSIAFASKGRRVFGIDRSHVGIAAATNKSMSLGLGDLVQFEVVDIASAESTRRAIDIARKYSAGQPIIFYLRFFLHSVPQDVQDSLLSTLTEKSVDGDVVAAEFRTDKDEALRKVHGNHYRRFQNAASFSKALKDVYGFDVNFEVESKGLAVYRDEDPFVYRVVATKLAEAVVRQSIERRDSSQTPMLKHRLRRSASVLMGPKWSARARSVFRRLRPRRG